MILIHPEYKKLLEQANIKTQRDIYQFAQGPETISSSSTSNIWIKYINEQCFYVKKYEYPKSWRYFLRKGRGLQELHSYDAFSKLCLPHPQVVCFTEKRKWARPLWSIIITAEIPNSADLSLLFAENQLPTNQQKIIIQQLAESLSLMHSHHFFHGDFKLRNILLNKSTYDLHFIDCPKGKRTFLFQSKFALKDLVTIYKSIHLFCPTMWQTFLLAYTQKTKSTLTILNNRIIKKFHRKYKK